MRYLLIVTLCMLLPSITYSNTKNKIITQNYNTKLNQNKNNQLLRRKTNIKKSSSKPLNSLNHNSVIEPKTLEGKRDTPFAYTKGKFKNNATAMLAVQMGGARMGNPFPALSQFLIQEYASDKLGSDNYFGLGFEGALGYQMIYTVNQKYSLYANIEASGQYIGITYNHGTALTDMNRILKMEEPQLDNTGALNISNTYYLGLFGGKLRFGFAFFNEALKTYATAGVFGVLTPHNNGLAALFGAGISQDIVKRRVALLAEFEAGPIFNAALIQNIFMVKTGIRIML